MSGTAWTDAQVAALRLMAWQGFNAHDVAFTIGRSPSSVYAKRDKLGLRMVFKRRRYSMPDGHRSTWNEAQRICAFANVPMPLAQLVVDTCEKHGLSVKSVRSACRLHDHFKCRTEIAVIARGRGYPLEAIGRAINRDHTTVIHALRLAA